MIEQQDAPMRQTGLRRRIFVNAAAVFVSAVWFTVALYVVPAVIPMIRGGRAWSDLGFTTLVDDGVVAALIGAAAAAAVILPRDAYRLIMKIGQRR